MGAASKGRWIYTDTEECIYIYIYLLLLLLLYMGYAKGYIGVYTFDRLYTALFFMIITNSI